MLKKPVVAIVFTSLYLLTYIILIHFSQIHIVSVMFLLSPFLILWMIYTVLKYGKHNGSALNNEEWGYQDKQREELDFF